MSYCLVIVFLNDAATTEIYTLSLHDALPICMAKEKKFPIEEKIFLPFPPPSERETSSTPLARSARQGCGTGFSFQDRKSTRLNSSHANISYAVFCLKKKKKKTLPTM